MKVELIGLISLAVLIGAAAGVALSWAIRSRARSTGNSSPAEPPGTRSPDDHRTREVGELKTGRFTVPPDKLLLGELRIAGPESLITLRGDDFFHLDREPHPHLTGTLYDQTKITLADCVHLSTTHGSGSEGTRLRSMTLFPHFAVEGKAHLDPDKPVIREIHFTFEDAPTLFYDFDAFGSMLDAKPFIAALVQANEREFGRSIRMGPNPQIAYFAGERLIVEARTDIGRIRVQHAPTFPFGNPRGVRIDNQIWVSIAPNDPVTLEGAVDALLSLLRFIEIAVGRAQSLPRFSIDIGTPDSVEILEVHWSHFPRRATRAGERPPHPADLPLDPIDNPAEFSKVMAAWLALDDARRIARLRTHGSFTQGHFYTTERLVAVANAFDLLPPDAVPKHIDLPAEVADAKTQGKALFRQLSPSDERESLLRAMGRLGHATLKQKVRHRANMVAALTGERFPALTWVCEQAVECRNFFVHGSPINFRSTAHRVPWGSSPTRSISSSSRPNSSNADGISTASLRHRRQYRIPSRSTARTTQ